MSNIRQFLGGSIKSVQRGVTLAAVTTASEQTTNVGISAVDLTKTVVSVRAIIVDVSTNIENGEGAACGYTLTTSTNLALVKPPSGVSYQLRYYWEVIEYY